MAFATLDDVDVAERAVGVRIDINSPVDDEGRPTSDVRLRAHRETLEELLASGARVAIMAHQGRPGGDTFTSLEAHARRLGALVDHDISYVDAVCSQDAREAVETLPPGAAVCLENVRFYSEEPMTFDPERAARTHLVQRLSAVFDLYVNDAFAVAHRSQPTVVGFPRRLPSVAGRLLTRELEALGNLRATPAPRVAVLAGAKVDDSLRVLERLLEEDLVETVFVGGLVANAFLVGGEGPPNEATAADLDRRELGATPERAQALHDRFGTRIQLPQDVAVERDGARAEVAIGSFPLPAGEVPRDIGGATIEAWQPRLAGAGTVVVNGTLGLVEDDRFERGTRAIFRAAGAGTHTLAGGGDTATAIRRFGIETFDHVSTGGGAAMTLLSGESLPGVAALEACDIALPN